MMPITDIIVITLVSAGILFMFVGGLGMIRLPDFYTRTHASSKVDTLGIIVLLLGLAVYEGPTLTSLKLILATLLVALTNPVTAHALARAALDLGLKPWTVPNRRQSASKEIQADMPESQQAQTSSEPQEEKPHGLAD